MPTDRHDDAARVGCPVCMGDGTTPRHGPGAATFRKPCKECQRVAALLREEVGKERANFRDFCRGLFSHEPRNWGVVLSSLQAAFPLKGEAPDGA